MADLKLIALESDDLPILAAHLQDAVLRIADISWQPRARRFALAANRFVWDNPPAAKRRAFAPAREQRRRAILRFEHVLAARVQGLDLTAKETVLSLLTITFEETAAPGGVITLVFAGDGAIRLDVECIEGEVRDLGPAWATRSRPGHKIVDEPDAPSADDDGDASFNS